MCLILLSWQPEANHKLVVAANRDEHFARPSETAHFWPDAPAIFAGRDQEFGGTWMGLSRNGRFAAVTNLRQQSELGEMSRGNLVRDFLQDTRSATVFFDELENQKRNYRPFNLVASDGKQLFLTDNVSPGWISLAPGTHAIGNLPISTPSIKREKGLTDFEQCLGQQLDATSLLAMLTDSAVSEPDNNLLYQELSRRFVSMKEYGTRSCSVVFQQQNGDSDFWEQNFDAQQSALPLRHHHITADN